MKEDKIIGKENTVNTNIPTYDEVMNDVYCDIANDPILLFYHTFGDRQGYDEGHDFGYDWKDDVSIDKVADFVRNIVDYYTLSSD